MKYIKAIGFDLFNTLITAEQDTLHDAMDRLMRSLAHSGFALNSDAFKRALLDATLRFLEQTKIDGRETHNRFWISAALETQGYNIPPDDIRISRAVDDYFSAFFDHCRLIPETIEMLETLKGQYQLGLLSNFTHSPAARGVIDSLGLAPFFEIVLISDDLGYRKPYPLVFVQLRDALGVKDHEMLYIGDDPVSDIAGARQAGLRPVWMTYVRDQNIPFVGGHLYPKDQEVDDDVPRIAKWQDLFTLLGTGQSL
jgi:putative hydrolase of the HAD superfamily